MGDSPTTDRLTDQDLAAMGARLVAANTHDKWRIDRRKHNYKDGTTHRYAVICRGRDIKGAEMTIQIADWLTLEIADWLASAPADMTALLAEVYRLRHERRGEALQKVTDLGQEMEAMDRIAEHRERGDD